MVAGVDLTYDTTAQAIEMAETIFGDGANVQSASYSGASNSSAIYSNGDAVAGNVTPGDTGIILSTGNATDFTNSNPSQSNLSTARSTNTSGVDNDADFNAVAAANTFDASFLVVDFIPNAGVDVLTMKFVFGSDEFPEYTSSAFNDMVGVWINGSHIDLTVSNSQASVGAVNQNNNTNLYNDNTSDQFNTEMDGFTMTLTLTIPVNVGVLNTIKIGVADVGDGNLDSNLLIAANSLQGAVVAGDDTVTMLEGGTKILDVLDNDTNTTVGTLKVTHINGQAISVNQTVTLPSGQTIKLTVDGTLEITTDSDNEAVNFSYGVASVDGSNTVLQSDVGFVTVDTIPCFVAGTLIETPEGKRAVETLEAGDLVITRDDGPQPLRWTGRRHVAAKEKLAPIQISANTMGTHETLMVSPLHRVLVKDVLAELMFGDTEVLIAARDLVNDHSIRPVEGGMVHYVHLMFDRHQIVYSNGLASESFFPGPQTTKSFEAEAIEEITTIFPELDIKTGDGYGPAARPLLKRYEASALMQGVA